MIPAGLSGPLSMISPCRNAKSHRGDSMPAPSPRSAKRQTSVSTTALLGQPSGAQPLRLPAAGGIAGEAGSKAALAKLDAAVAEMKAAAVAPLLDRAIKALQLADAVEGR